MKLKGVLTHSDVEGGHWLLKTDSGDEYQLTGAIKDAKDGIRGEMLRWLMNAPSLDEVPTLRDV